jgi:hypothetical protein
MTIVFHLPDGEIARMECRQIQRTDELEAQAQIEDWIAESPVQLCPGCNAPFKSLGEAYCEECQKSSEVEWHNPVEIKQEYCPF